MNVKKEKQLQPVRILKYLFLISGCLVIAAANRQAGEAALYYLTNDW